MKYIDARKLEAALALHYAEITVPVITDEGGVESYIRRSEIHDILKNNRLSHAKAVRG